MDLGIRGKTALVVGASKSIGRAAAVQLAREGAHVLAVARDVDLLEELEMEIRGLGGECRVIGLDMMEPGAPEGLAGFVRQFGALDIVYHAMGGSWAGIRSYTSPAADFAQVWRFNLGVAIDINNLFLPGMLERRWGRIVHTTTDATKGNWGNSPYTSSKYALEGYVRTLARQVAAQGVVVTAVAPGPIYAADRWSGQVQEAERAEYFQHHVPIARFANPEEIAGVVAMLCGVQASYMPGEIVRVDGGSR